LDTVGYRDDTKNVILHKQVRLNKQKANFNVRNAVVGDNDCMEAIFERIFNSAAYEKVIDIMNEYYDCKKALLGDKFDGSNIDFLEKALIFLRIVGDKTLISQEDFDRILKTLNNGEERLVLTRRVPYDDSVCFNPITDT